MKPGWAPKQPKGQPEPFVHGGELRKIPNPPKQPKEGDGARDKETGAGGGGSGGTSYLVGDDVGRSEQPKRRDPAIPDDAGGDSSGEHGRENPVPQGGNKAMENRGNDPAQNRETGAGGGSVVNSGGSNALLMTLIALGCIAALVILAVQDLGNSSVAIGISNALATAVGVVGGVSVARGFGR